MSDDGAKGSTGGGLQSLLQVAGLSVHGLQSASSWSLFIFFLDKTIGVGFFSGDSTL